MLTTLQPLARKIELLLLMVVLSLAGATNTALGQVAPITEAQAQNSGPGHPWQGGLPGINLYSLAKQTTLPIMTLPMRGGMRVDLALSHNSQAVYSNPTLSSKWMHTFDAHLDVWTESGVQHAAFVWGNHRIQRFERVGGRWINLDGYRDSLSQSGANYVFALRFPDLYTDWELTASTQWTFEPSLTAGRYRLKNITDGNSNTILFSYDSSDRLTKATDPSGRELRFTYNATSGKLTKIQLKVGSWSRTWTLSHDSLGNLVKVKYPTVTTDTGPQTYFVKVAYDSNNNVKSFTSRGGQVWKYSYNGNRVKWAQWPGNTNTQRVNYTYTSSTVRKVSNPRGVESTYTYDSLSRLVQVQDALGNTATNSYSDLDYSWLPSAITPPSGTQVQFDYDANGNLIGVIDPTGNRTDLGWDSQDRLIQVLEPLITDAWGLIEPARRRTDFVYDAQDNLTAIRKYTDATNYLETQFNYNPNGELIQVTNPLGNTTNYTYDLYGNLTQATTPMGRTSQWLYENAGSTFGFTLPNARLDGLGQRTNLLRDEWGRLRTSDYPAGVDTQYSYDGESRLIRMVDATGTTDWIYTPQGWLSSEIKGTRQALYDYLPNGLRSRLTEIIGSGSRILDYAYDARDLLASITEAGLTAQFIYDADGRLILRQLPNGAHTEYAYLQGQLQSMTHFDGANTIIRSFAYSYQENGLVKQVLEADGSLVRYGYDLLNRLGREERAGLSPYIIEYTYDAVGNRLTQIRDGQLTTYAYDSDNHPLNANTPSGLDTYTWNPNGQLVERWRQGIGNQFQYDFEGRLVGIIEWNRSRWLPSRNYAYDGLDRRVSRWVYSSGMLNSSSIYGYDEFDVFREATSYRIGGSNTMLYTWGDGLLATRDETSGFGMWSVTDGTGSLRGWTDNHGQLGSYSSVFTGFGKTVTEWGNRPPLAFAGDIGFQSDGDAGLIYTGAGWYDPELDMALPSGLGMSLSLQDKGCPCDRPTYCMFTGYLEWLLEQLDDNDLDTREWAQGQLDRLFLDTIIRQGRARARYIEKRLREAAAAGDAEVQNRIQPILDRYGIGLKNYRVRCTCEY